MKSISRRRLIGGIGSMALGLSSVHGWAQAAAGAAPGAGQGLLAKLQAAKKVRVGVAVDFPFSALDPDGTLSGVAPTVTKTIMGRLGVPEIEGFVATYGELVPGMMAGRWDFISAALTISRARCEQVKFAEPIMFDGDVIVAPKDFTGIVPLRLSDLAKGSVVVGVQAGGADLKNVMGAGVGAANIRQFANEQAILDGLLAKRIDFGIMSPGPLRGLLRQRNLTLKTTYPVADAPPHGASCAFRMQDTDLYAAYSRELQAMKASGELATILKKFDYETTPELLKVTIAQLCA
jgi:polar amino acid transport system substrate-binding protein